MTIQRDKIMHFVTGAGLSVVLSLALNVYVGVLGTLAVGLFKEYVKDAGHLQRFTFLPKWLGGIGTVDIKDAIATGLGGCAGAFIYTLF